MKTLCVSLETAKKLKTAGWKKPTALAWVKHSPWFLAENKELPEWELVPVSIFDIRGYEESYYAPTAEEVLRELPEKIDLNEWRRDLQFIFISPEKGKWEVSYGQFKKFKNKSLAEAAAQMWLWCVEQGYIKTEAKP